MASPLKRRSLVSPVIAIALVGLAVLALVPSAQAQDTGRILATGCSPRPPTPPCPLRIFTMDDDGSALAAVSPASGLGSAPQAGVWSPDGSRIAFGAGNSTNSTAAEQGIFVMDANGGGLFKVAGTGAADVDPSWAPDGERIAFSGALGVLKVATVDGPGPTTALPITGSDPSWSPAGDKIAYTARTGAGTPDIFAANVNGSNAVNLTNTPSDDEGEPDYSPDGRRIAFASDRPPPTGTDDGRSRLWIMDDDGRNVTNFTVPPANPNSTTAQRDFAPSWSPDGQSIAFMRTHQNSSGFIMTKALGDPAAVVITPLPTATVDHSFTDPDWHAPPDPDSDGDALPDSWEENGIDVDGDGTPELDLPAMGADPEHKDIFIEIDFMSGHRMADAQLAAVTAAFATAPVGNPDGKAGITLHIDNGSGSTMDPVSGSTWGSLSDQDSLTHQNVLGSDFTVDGERHYDWSEFEARRQTNLLSVRRPAFHYVIAAHSGPGQRFSGTSRDITASDFIIAMHENCVGTTPPLTTECTATDPEYAASTFMHELGHNLGLRHGGTDEDARKPNYLSVMNYNFGYGLILFDNSFGLDYSRFELPLNESSLDEEIGFGIDEGALTAFKTVFTCPNRTTRYRIALTTRHTDWNCDRSITGIGTVSSDVSGNGVTGQLSGPIDWDRIEFAGGGIGGLAQPPGADDTLITEPTPEELRDSREILETGTTPPIDPPPIEPPPVTPRDEAAPETEIGKRPKNKLKKRKATYTFSSSEDGSSFECRLDKKPFKTCSSRAKLKRLKRGKHFFEVRAIDAAGNVDATPAKDRFRVTG